MVAKTKKVSVTKSKKAGLVYPVARFNKMAKRESGLKRVGGSAPVYLAAVAEYVGAEILTMAGELTKKQGRKRITAEDLLLAVRGDPDVRKLCAGLSVSAGEHMKQVGKQVATKCAAKPAKAKAKAKPAKAKSAKAKPAKSAKQPGKKRKSA